MTSPIGFGIIGCGNIGNIHAENIKKIDNARLIAVCDSDLNRAKTVGEKYKVEYFDDYSKLLDNERIDVINICTPSGTHMETCIKAANSGKHILCEKPLEVTLEKIDAIIKEVDRNNVKLGVVLQKRVQTPNKLTKTAIDDGKFGDIVSGSFYLKGYRSQEYYDQGKWRGTWEHDGGGCLMNQGIHDIDLLQWFLGPVESVYAIVDTVAHERIEVEDIALAIVKFKNQAKGIIECSTSCYPGFPSSISIYGTKGTINLEDDKLTSWEFINPTKEDTELSKRIMIGKKSCQQDGTDYSDPVMLVKDSHKHIIEDMVKAIEGDIMPEVTGEEARKSVEIILAIYKSAKTGKEVKLPL
ncbi:MAG: Gfo/Idh/MocA family oxidoreductase [Atribacterota bacterium]|nr:Gfo/Idh/MocA family oxidoreductase [Atribacterota bacterium]